MDSCESCRFWKRDESFAFKEVPGPNIGICRRFPPNPIYCGSEKREGSIIENYS